MQVFKNKWFWYAVAVSYGIKILYLLLAAYWLKLDWAKDDLLFSFCRNDSFWYDGITRVGYPLTPPEGYNQSSYAFFPLYPLLVRPFYWITQNFSSAAFLLSLFTTFAWLIFQFKYLVEIGFTVSKIFLFTLFYQVFPFHYFFHMYYSEQLFSLILIAALWCLHKNKSGWLFIACILLSLCRPTGIVFAMGLVFYPYTTFWQNRGYKKALNWLKFWPLSGALAGILIFQLYSYYRCGDFLANKHAMLAWNRIFCWPWESFMVQDTLEYKVMALVVITLLLIALIAVIKTPWPFKLYALITLIFPLTTGSTDSYYRYFAVNFPIFSSLFRKIQKHKTALYVILIVCFILNLYTYHYWVTVHGQLAY